MSWFWNRQRTVLLRAEELLLRSEQEYAQGHLEQAQLLLEEVFSFLSPSSKTKQDTTAVLDRAHQLKLQIAGDPEKNWIAVAAAIRAYRNWSRSENLDTSAKLTHDLVSILDSHQDQEQAPIELAGASQHWERHNPAAQQATTIRGVLAERYWRLGRTDDAISLWQRVLQVGVPEDNSALPTEVLADALLQVGQAQQAYAINPCLDTARYLPDTETQLQYQSTTTRQRLLHAVVLSRTQNPRNGLDLLKGLEQELRCSADVDAWVLALRCLAEIESEQGLIEQSLAHGEQAYRAAIRLWDWVTPSGLGTALSYAEILDRAEHSDAALELRRTIRAQALAGFAQLPGGAQQLSQLDEQLRAAGLRISDPAVQPRNTTFAPQRRYRLVRALRDGHRAEALREAMFLAEAALRAGHLDITVATYADACEIAGDEELFGPLPLIEATNGLAMATEANGESSAAIELYETNLAQAERMVGVDHPMVRVLRANLADTLENVGRVDDAAWLWSRNVFAPREGLTPVAVGDTVRLGWLALRTARPQVALRLALRALSEARATATMELILSAAALIGNVAQEPELQAQQETVDLLCEILTPDLVVSEATLPLLIHVLNVGAELAVEITQRELALQWLNQAYKLIGNQQGLLRQFGPRLAEAYLDCDAVEEAMELLDPLLTKPDLSNAATPLHYEQARQAWDRAISMSGLTDPYPSLRIVESISDGARMQRNFFLAQETQLAASENTTEPEIAVRAYEQLAHHASHSGLDSGDFLFGLLPVRIATIYEREGHWNQALDTIMTALEQIEARQQWTSVAGVMLTARALWQLRYLGQFDHWYALVLRDAKNTADEQGYDSSITLDCLRRLAYALRFVGEIERAKAIDEWLANHLEAEHE